MRCGGLGVRSGSAERRGHGTIFRSKAQSPLERPPRPCVFPFCSVTSRSCDAERTLGRSLASQNGDWAQRDRGRRRYGAPVDATVTQLWRYPAKSMMGEQLHVAEVGPVGWWATGGGRFATRFGAGSRREEDRRADGPVGGIPGRAGLDWHSAGDPDRPTRWIHRGLDRRRRRRPAERGARPRGHASSAPSGRRHRALSPRRSGLGRPPRGASGHLRSNRGRAVARPVGVPARDPRVRVAARDLLRCVPAAGADPAVAHSIERLSPGPRVDLRRFRRTC